MPYDRIDGSTGGEGIFLKTNSDQEWQWVSGQSCDELSLFQTWDSSPTVVDSFQGEADHPCCTILFQLFDVPLTFSFLGQTFHAAFWNPKWDGVGPNRESVEMRLIVLFNTESRE